MAKQRKHIIEDAIKAFSENRSQNIKISFKKVGLFCDEEQNKEKIKMESK